MFVFAFTVCLMNTDDTVCNVNLDGLELIGKGNFGKVYKYGDNKVIKEVEIGNKSAHMYDVVKNTVTNELYALVKARELEAEGVSHGFAKLYDFAKCTIVESEDEIKKREDDMRRGVGRNMDYSLHNVGVRFVLKYYPIRFDQIFLKLKLKMNHVSIREIWLNIMFKLWYNIHVMHEKMKIVHGDLDLNNVMFEPWGDENEDEERNEERNEEGERRGYFKYVIHGEEYYIPNSGYTPVIIDFGNSVKIDTIRNQKKKEELLRKDFAFFFGEEKRGNYDGLLFREGNMREMIYRKFNTQEIIDKLGGKGSEKVKKAFATVRKRHPHLSGVRFMKKIHTQLAKLVGGDVDLYKTFDRNLDLLQSVRRPDGIVAEFNERLRSKKGWLKEDMVGELRETNILL